MAVMFTIAKGGHNCPLTDKQIYRMLHRPIIRILFSLKKELNSDTCHKWMNLEDIMLQSTSHTHKITL